MTTRIMQLHVEVVYSPADDLGLLMSNAPLQTVEHVAESACQIVRKRIRRLPKDHVCSLKVHQRDIDFETLERELGGLEVDTDGE